MSKPSANVIPKPSTPSPEITISNRTITIRDQPFQFRTFAPTSSNPKGLILFNHGFCEHLGYYNDTFTKLAREGFTVVIFDQRGSGNTARNSTEYGLTNEAAVFDDLDKIIELLIAGEIVKFDFGTKGSETTADTTPSTSHPPLFLWGHSMGGGITLTYGIKGQYRHSIRGYVGCAPLITLHPSTQPPWILAKLLTFLAKRTPTLHMPTTLNLDHVTRDKANTEWLKNDPLVKNVCTVGQMNDMILRGRALTDPAWVKSFEGDQVLGTSVLIYHGEADQINWLEGSQAFIDICPVKDKELWALPGFKHSVHLEPTSERDPVEDRLISWFKAHI
ncbi:alpha/beta-hydrolase [Nadsonia fulvescens var. elongata DSM 6958]|uniref:Alpha/beta-hydrolase n=1 Tax=Nadsonia fulvescens var. elongata DSM 6958 TaxID=857566 RepID=A0A1E3PJV8_9ASCO|nr:alpha/beta-hydrolase [Nadsonia fulvescens var. elongata DSM 6958]